MPRTLQPGDTIAIISPAGPVDETQLKRGIAVLESWGYKVRIAPHALERNDYLAGSDDKRAADLQQTLLDDNTAAVICSRGGYGSGRILKLLDWEALTSVEPKPFVGFSDVGAFQLNLLARNGWCSYSGPQAALGLGGDLTERSREHLRRLLAGNAERFKWATGEPITLTPVRAGEAKGVLVPICLSILASLIGTSFLPDLTGAILCLEDVNEAPYRVDRMFWQLREAGVLKGISALILGDFSYQDETIGESVLSITRDIFCGFEFPIWAGLPYGHIRDRVTLTMGALAMVTADGVFQEIEPDK